MTRIALALIAFAGLAVPATAAPPTVEGVAHPVGRRGTEFTVTLTGARLSEPRELMFYQPGITCTKLEAASENEVRATLKAAADCRLGEYPFRLRTAGGAAELRTVYVTPLPLIPEAEGEQKRPQAVPLNCTVSGTIEPADVDAYTVALKKGQRLSAEVVGVRLGGSEVVDTVLSVLGPDGTVLAAVDDTPLFRQDPFVSLLAPADGTYTIRVRDTGHGGGDGYRYALHVGTFVRPAFVFPVGGPAGTKVHVTLHGDPAGPIDQTVTLPAVGEPFEFFPSDGATTAPTPIPFRVSPFPNAIEAEPNDVPSRANAAVPWPVAFNGTIAANGDVDHYRFAAREGDAIQVEAFAYRAGSPLDTVVAVLDSAGRVIGSGDDDATHDSRFRVTIPADGEYAVRVSDKRGKGGPGFVYRVELDRPRPDIAVFLPGPMRKSQERQTIVVPRGNRTAAFLAVRRTGVDGDVALDPKEMPAGVKLTAGPIPADRYFVPVVFAAAADAPLGGGLADITGTAHGPDGSVIGGFEQVVDLAHGPGDTAYHSVRVDRLAVVVVDEAPYAVELVPPAAPLTADGKLDLPVKVTRGKGFTGPVEVSLPYLPPGVEAEPTVTIPEGQSDGVISLSAQAGAPAGEWKLVAQAKAATPARGRRNPADAGMAFDPAAALPRRRRSAPVAELPFVASAPTALKVAAPAIRGRFDTVAVEQGKTAAVVCRLDASTPLPANAKAALDGLPPRAAAKPVEVRSDAKEITFTVAVDPTTPPGEHDTLVAVLEGTVGGQKVVYRLGRTGTLQVNAPGGVKVDAAGKPLSPLDALRLEAKGQ